MFDDGSGAGVADGPGVGVMEGGFGLDGMAERVAACGGWLRAGPRPEGGFEVRARVPASAVPPAPAVREGKT